MGTIYSHVMDRILERLSDLLRFTKSAAVGSLFKPLFLDSNPGFLKAASLIESAQAWDGWRLYYSKQQPLQRENA
jgi:hypothetical protein